MTAKRCNLTCAGLALLLLVAAPAALAQSITTEGLDAAKAFAPGIEIDGELPRTAWSGTDARTAVRLLQDIEQPSPHPVVRDMRRRVVLAGLAPPSGADSTFDRARVEAAQILATPDEYERFAARNPAARDPQLRAEAAIAQGDLTSACNISDTITQGRADTFWVRLRAACHDMRDETAMAELARDLLRDRGEDPKLIIPDAPTGFWVEVMDRNETDLIAFMREAADLPERIAEAPQENRVEEEPASIEAPASGPINLLPGADVPFLFEDMSESEESDAEPLDDDIEDATEPDITLADALIDETDQGTARLFLLGLAGDAKAVSAFVARAAEVGLDPDRVMSRIPALLDPTDMATIDLPLFARYAVATGDIPLIQALFLASDNPVLQQRLALASDALGGAYFGQPLGDGLETDLEAGGPVALGDVMIALGLGARLSDRALTSLEASGLAMDSTDSLLDWVMVDQALDRGTQAETLLRLAAIIPETGVAGESGSEHAVTLYRTLRALRRSGFSDLAGRLAAYEFLRGL